MNLPTKPNLSNIVDSWLSGRSEKTILAYRRDIEVFAKWLQVRSIDEAAQRLLSQGHGDANALVYSYRAYMIEQYAPHTINRRLAAIRSLVKLARMFGLIEWALDVENVRAENIRDTRGPKVNDVADGIFKCDLTPKGHRDKALLRVMFDLALRRSEICALNCDDFDGETLRVKGKGHRGKTTLHLPPITSAAIRNWLKYHPGTEPLFTSMRKKFNEEEKESGYYGKRLHPNSVLYLTKHYCGVSPHKIRHTSITRAIKKHNNLAEVKSFSRHSNIATLMIYFDDDGTKQGEIAKKVSQDIS